MTTTVSPPVKTAQKIAKKIIKFVNPPAAKAVKKRKDTRMKVVKELERMGN